MNKPRTNITLARVEFIRSINNELWMSILRVALKHAPDETKKVLRQINENDSAINHQLRNLAE